MNLVQKAALFYRKEGIKNTLRRTAEKCWESVCSIPFIFKEHLFLQKYLAQIQKKTQDKRVYLVISNIDWNTPLFQRPHQIAMVLSKREKAHVLFISDVYRYDRFAGLFAVNEHLDVISRRIAPHLAQALGTARHITVFMSWPRYAKLLECLPYQELVYEYIDDLSLLYYATEELRRTHYRLIQEADLTVCTARALYEDALPHARRALLSPNAGDYSFFHENRNCASDPQVRCIAKSYECVLGYYGCLAEWFDYELVIEVARRKPTWCFVLVGYCFDGTVSRLREAAVDNIFLIDAQPYQKLPSFVSAFDIQTIPFCLNSVTKATSPVKLFEYMASGKPILTSKMPECLRYRSVTTYENADDFLRKAEQLLECRNDPDYVSVMEVEAKENTWEARVEEILNELNGEKNERK